MHVLAYLNYYFNRYEIYTYKRYRIFVLFSYLYFYLQKRVDMVFDSMNRFESRIVVMAGDAENSSGNSH